MDNPPDPARSTYSPRPGELLVAAGGGLMLGVLAALTDDRPGQVLVGLAAAGLLVVAALGALRRPRVVADAAGITIRGPLRTRHLDWVDVGSVLLRHHRRLGLEVGMLEISGTDDVDGLLVLSRGDLGTDPREVHPVLTALHLAALRGRPG